MGVVTDSLLTEDQGVAEQYVRRVYPDASIRESRRPFSYAHEVRGDERASLARFSISAWSDIVVEFEGVLGVGQVLSGDYRATSNGEQVDPTAPFLLRPGVARSQSERLDLLMLNLDEQALARFASAWHGVDDARLRFPGVAPVAPGQGSWSSTVAAVREILEAPELLTNDLLRTAAVDMLFAAALTTFQVEVGGRPVGSGTDGALPRAVRRALAYIEDNAEQAVTVEDIAAASRLSVRGLQAAFRRHLDTTPVRALRAVRLSAAHDDLLAADPTATGVSEIALARGFRHLGRFAAEYRRQYGESPSATLQRGGL